MDFDAIKESQMFDHAADYYDIYRPSYPDEIIQALVNQTQLNLSSRTLEIGSGSGKATDLFKVYGFQIQCIDPGKKLVENGRSKFMNYPNVSFECIRFEELEPISGVYDVIFAAQSFHWVPQPKGYQMCAQMLHQHGYLAPFWNMYRINNCDADNELLFLSNKYGGFADFLNEEECEERIQSIASDIQQSNLFEKPSIVRHEWKQEYTAEEYFGFVLTGNRFLQLTEETKKNAFEEIIKLSNKFGGKITQNYLCVLYIARKK